MKAWPVLAAACLCACAHEHTRSGLSEAAVGGGGTVPIGFASGEASRMSFLRFDAPTRDLERQALARARGKALEAELVEGTVERRSSCLLSCSLPLARRVRVTVSGTLVRPTGYRDLEGPPKAAPLISHRSPTPTAAALYARLMEIHKRDPAAADSFYLSLDPSTRGVLRDFILSMKGRLPEDGRGFRPAGGLSAEELGFLSWFIHGHTPYRLAD